MNVTIIIPTYNESENIQALVRQIFEVAKTIKKHAINILVVDDNSPDGTADLVRDLQPKYPHLHLITGKKEGLGKAYLRGMNYASSKLAAEVMFEMDADFSHDPKEIPAFLAKIDEGYDLVIGSRYIPGGSIPANWGLHRIIFSVMGNLIVRTALFNFKHHEWTNGYRAIRTPLFKKIRTELEEFKGYTFQVSFLHKAFLHNAKVAEIPCQFKDRVHGESKISSEYIINLLRYLAMTTIKNPPRQFRFLLVGGTSFILQSVLFAVLKVFMLAEIANAVGFTVAVTNNFFSNNFWTFNDRKKAFTPRILVTFAKFYGLSLLALSIQTLVIRSTVIALGRSEFSEWLGFFIGVFFGMFVNYLLYSRVVWKSRPA